VARLVVYTGPKDEVDKIVSKSLHGGRQLGGVLVQARTLVATTNDEIGDAAAVAAWQMYRDKAEDIRSARWEDPGAPGGPTKPREES
jgi:hypothetical protein